MQFFVFMADIVVVNYGTTLCVQKAHVASVPEPETEVTTKTIEAIKPQR